MDLRRTRAVIIVTILSAAAGALAGLAVAFVLDAVTGAFAPDGFLFGFAALTGAALGSVLGPIAGFGFLRRVPLGRLFGQTIVGAALGALLGLSMGILFPRADDFTLIFGGGTLGFAVAALLLWRRFRGTSSGSAVSAG